MQARDEAGDDTSNATALLDRKKGERQEKGEESVLCVGGLGFNVIDRGFVTHVRVSRAKFGRGVGIPVRKTPCAVVVCC